METKVNYHYSYFIYSYFLKNIEYKEYICKLLNNKNYKLKIFEKEKDLEIYDFFKNNIKKDYFNTFYINKKNNNNEKILNNKCNIFEYKIKNKNKEKNNLENNLIYEISKIELICFSTGICFLIIKTELLNEKLNLNNILNFNYKMKDINSEFSKLKSYEKINIENNLLKNNFEVIKK